MEELFETYTEHGEALGLVPRSEVHRRGLWHRSVGVFVFNRKGELLLQKRAAEKDLWANCWDYSVGEHVQPGESDADAAVRGLKEELGICTSVRAIGAVHALTCADADLGVCDREFHQAFTAEHEGPFVLAVDEVAEIRFAALAQVAGEIDEDASRYTPWVAAELKRLGFI